MYSGVAPSPCKQHDSPRMQVPCTTQSNLKGHCSGHVSCVGTTRGRWALPWPGSQGRQLPIAPLHTPDAPPGRRCTAAWPHHPANSTTLTHTLPECRSRARTQSNLKGHCSGHVSCVGTTRGWWALPWPGSQGRQLPIAPLHIPDAPPGRRCTAAWPHHPANSTTLTHTLPERRSRARTKDPNPGTTST
jgi:hypothetical protein